MLESLNINGRTYMASDQAAHEVGVAASYIERLAKGKWIDASFVQGQCFVDVHSLEAFMDAAADDVALQLQEAARRERAIAALEAYTNRLDATRQPQGVWFVVGQVGVVTVCGLLLSVLTMSAIEAQVSFEDVVEGVSQSAQVLREKVALPATLWFGEVDYTSFMQNVETVPEEPFAPAVSVTETNDGLHTIQLLDK